MASPVQAVPEIAGQEELARFVAHVYADLHDISRRLYELELVLERFTKLADIYEPQLQKYAQLSRMRQMGRGRRGGKDAAGG